MITASFVGVVKTILIIILVFYGIRLVTRFALRAYVKKMQRKMEDQMYQRQDSKKEQRQQGDVTIEYEKDKKRNKKNRNKDDDDDYVDYEIVD